MVRDELPRRSDRGTGILVGLSCLLAGLAIGRVATGPKSGGATSWQQLDHLHQMYI
jgi:hypothetical protein